jgi:uncharacterized membrane protein
MSTSDAWTGTHTGGTGAGRGLASYVKLFAALVPVFFTLDTLSLGIIASDFYRSRLGHLLSAEVNWPLSIVIVDIPWGVVLCTVVATAGYATGRRMPAAPGD